MSDAVLLEYCGQISPEVIGGSKIYRHATRNGFLRGLFHVFRRSTGRLSSSNLRDCCSSASSPCFRTLSAVVALRYRPNLVQNVLTPTSPVSCSQREQLAGSMHVLGRPRVRFD